jgi:dTDP-4-dehydrorhamnose reductase
MKAVVLGADGMLGHKMFDVLHSRFPTTVGTVRSDPTGSVRPWMSRYPREAFRLGLELMDLADLRTFLEDQRPEFIVNCAGIIKHRSDAKTAPSILVNALMPHLLAEWAAAWGGRLIHFSTDCVFSGRRGNYTESDPSDAEDLYGRSKFLGEVHAGNALTIRMSTIGRELKNFYSLLEWFLAQRGTVQGYVKAIYSGLPTTYLAGLTARLISEMPDLSGLYQVASAPISKYDLLLKLKAAYRLDVRVEPNENFVCDRSLNGGAFACRTGWAVPAWDQLLDELAADATPYDHWRRE